MAEQRLPDDRNTGMTARFLGNHGLAIALLIGFFGGIALGATGTGLGTIGYYRATVQNKTGAYTLVATNAAASSDCGTEIVVTVSSTAAVTLPNSGVIGCQVTIVQGGTAKVTLTAASGGTLISPHSFTGTYAQGSAITAQVIANAGSAAQWLFGGDGS